MTFRDKQELVYTGGSASLTSPELKETLVARRLFVELGLDPNRVIFEGQSRNTHENAIKTFELVKPAKGDRWVLITSAMHMPRAVGVFRKAGWDPIPYPVDFTTLSHGKTGLWRGLGPGLGGLNKALKEWIGLVAYRLLGRTDNLFPGPQV